MTQETISHKKAINSSFLSGMTAGFSFCVIKELRVNNYKIMIIHKMTYLKIVTFIDTPTFLFTNTSHVAKQPTIWALTSFNTVV